MEERFFCANCENVGHILGVNKIQGGVSLKEYRRGSLKNRVNCELFIIPDNKLEILKQLLDKKVDVLTTISSTVNYANINRDDKKKSKKVDFKI